MGGKENNQNKSHCQKIGRSIGPCCECNYASRTAWYGKLHQHSGLNQHSSCSIQYVLFITAKNKMGQGRASWVLAWEACPMPWHDGLKWFKKEKVNHQKNLYHDCMSSASGRCMRWIMLIIIAISAVKIWNGRNTGDMLLFLIPVRIHMRVPWSFSLTLILILTKKIRVYFIIDKKPIFGRFFQWHMFVLYNTYCFVQNLGWNFAQDLKRTYISNQMEYVIKTSAQVIEQTTFSPFRNPVASFPS